MKNPRLLTSTMLATVAITGLMAGSTARAATTGGNSSTGIGAASVGLLADDSSGSQNTCAGKNSCKGKGGCKSGDNGCKGKNSCKGKGGCNTKEGCKAHSSS